jgi:spore maturation protein CgeB
LNEYPETGANIGLLPFAASQKHHYYIPQMERKYDVVIIAHAREDRLPIVEKLENICKVGTYGAGWKNSLGVVNGSAHVKAINSGKMYISFSRTVAGFDNVKVGLFEAMACNQVVITSYMDELQDYFDIGTEILCYKTEDELYDIVSYYLNNEIEREKIRQRGYARFLKNHTYEMRWNAVLKEVYKNKGFLTKRSSK